jgi:DNA modification methylase
MKRTNKSAMQTRRKASSIKETSIEYFSGVREYALGNGILFHGDCLKVLSNPPQEPYDLTFLDPPFNQNKDYSDHEDNMPEEEYWAWMLEVSRLVYAASSPGAAIYFMQREKNTERVLKCLRESGWSFQNLIIWKKKTSAVPGLARFGKQFQIIAFATKGERPRVFHRLRIDPPLPPTYKYDRENGLYVTDVWDDIRELTSGYFAGDEPLRDKDGNRLHKQQSPIELLLRIILSSTNPEDVVFDPFAGTGTSFIVADQLKRRSVIVEKGANNIHAMQKRFAQDRPTDNVSQYYSSYKHTEGIREIWGSGEEELETSRKTVGKQISFL